MFLFRPQPLLGESLSSWRQRAAQANGYRLFPVLPRELRRRDPDQLPSMPHLEMLSSGYGIETHVLQQLTLEAFTGRLWPQSETTLFPHWILPLRYTRSKLAFGPHYCPRCLQEGQVGYWHLLWRLAFLDACPKHSCSLQDSCPHCGTYVWPHAATQISLWTDAVPGLLECPMCQGDLRRARTRQRSKQLTVQLLALLSKPTITLSPELKVPTHEYFSALTALCQLWLRRRSPSNSWILKPHQDPHIALDAVNRVELLSPADRHALIEISVHLLKDWPRNFLPFCEERGITLVHFTNSPVSYPSWFGAVVHEYLAQSVRGVTAHQVEQAVSALKKSHQLVNKQNLQRLLGTAQARLVRKAAARRTCATAHELATVAKDLERCALQLHCRSNSALAAARNAAVLTLAILKQQPYSTIASLSHAQVLRTLQISTANKAADCLRRVGLAAYERVLAMRLDLWTAQEVSCGQMLNFDIRGGTLPLHAPRRLLARAMARLDPRLKRDCRVFHALV